MKLGCLLLAFAGVAAAPVACAVVGDDYTYSEGARSGVVTKFSQKGVLFKTYEGELAMDGFKANANSGLSNVFEFSVMDTSLVDDMEAARDSGQRVKIPYTQTLSHLPWKRDTDYKATGIEVVTSPGTQVQLNPPAPGQ